MKGWFRRHALRRPAEPPESQPADADDLPHATTEPVVQDDLWERCPQCREILYARELHGNLQVCPKCGHHWPPDRPGAPRPAHRPRYVARV